MTPFTCLPSNSHLSVYLETIHMESTIAKPDDFQYTLEKNVLENHFTPRTEKILHSGIAKGLIMHMDSILIMYSM